MTAAQPQEFTCAQCGWTDTRPEKCSRCGSLRTTTDPKVVSLAAYRDAKRFERGRLALLRVRNIAEPLRSMQARAEQFADEHWLGCCNAFRSYLDA